MQRDKGRFDISLKGFPELDKLVQYMSPINKVDTNTNIVTDSHSNNIPVHAPWLDVLDGIFESDYCINSMGVVLSTGGNLTSSQYWHADGRETVMPYNAICLFIPLCDLNDTTGYTSLWPGTHHYSQNELLEHQLPSIMPSSKLLKGAINRGDVMLYDYKTIHRGEANNMPNVSDIRPIFYIIYAKQEFREGNFTDDSIDNVKV